MSINKIKLVALNLFAKNGYEGTSLSAIAEGVGMKKASIYYHFKSKEDLFMTIFDDILNDEIARMKKLTQEIKNYKVEEKLYSMFQFYYEKNETNKVDTIFWKRAMLFSPVALSESIKMKFITYENVSNGILASIFEEGIENGIIKSNNIKNLLAAFYCLIDGVFVELHYYGRDAYKTRLDSIWNVFWTGIINID
ncbi:TetR/AcrR family transcriptional regulator [Marinisporobacter balticus]|uniref:TetR family transcriptional regulator n=1 Tax=Marinisporobacter balticus TaxID=2018667 RepID=A0A4R2KX26_9FIRM|nr:TetR/AcrR family transcriptional regulator [Marinisporobacter balticus]TCO77427.1 TetR family transcriptional regulator [Marinisporobacter balticus]